MRSGFTVLFVFCLMSSMPLLSRGQRLPNYTLLQAGGIYGMETSAVDKPMNGYQFQFIFGKNFYDRTFIGLGLGNDVYRGKPMVGSRGTSARRVNTMPIFADFRWLVRDVSMLGRMGVMANAGYAPGLGSDFYRGFMGKAGVVYTHMLTDRNDLHFSLGYGFQQFDSRYVFQASRQHNLFLTVGLFVF